MGAISGLGSEVDKGFREVAEVKEKRFKEIEKQIRDLRLAIKHLTDEMERNRKRLDTLTIKSDPF